MTATSFKFYFYSFYLGLRNAGGIVGEGSSAAVDNTRALIGPLRPACGESYVTRSYIYNALIYIYTFCMSLRPFRKCAFKLKKNWKNRKTQIKSNTTHKDNKQFRPIK